MFNVIANQEILGDQSDFSLYVEWLVSDGMNGKSRTGSVPAILYYQSPFAGLGGFMSGEVMAGIGRVYSNVSNTIGSVQIRINHDYSRRILRVSRSGFFGSDKDWRHSTGSTG
jgi:hypothetical protein